MIDDNMAKDFAICQEIKGELAKVVGKYQAQTGVTAMHILGAAQLFFDGALIAGLDLMPDNPMKISWLKSVFKASETSLVLHAKLNVKIDLEEAKPDEPLIQI